MDAGTFTSTTIIATIFSLIFGAAALWNAHVRRRHLTHLKPADAKNETRVQFKPMPEEPPGKFRSTPEAKATRHGKGPPTVHDKPAQVFRQIGASGNAYAKPAGSAENLYIWE